MIRRILSVLRARNLEFVRDRSSFGWNLFMPALLVVGLAVVFSGPSKPLFKVGVLAPQGGLSAELHPFLATRYVDFVAMEDAARATESLRRHRLDLLLDLRQQPFRFWVNQDSPRGYLARLLLKGSGGPELREGQVQGRAIRYVDWLIPGILGMNMMFSCLFGVGFVIVRYRKNGYLKRLYATPLTAFEFVAAQVGSRFLLIVGVSVLIYGATDLIIGFAMFGSYWTLLLLAMVSAATMISLGLVVAARVQSEEFAGGLLNLISWPMMVLSEVWFSLEGTSPWIQQISGLLPLTHMVAAARAVMLDGAGIVDIRSHLLILVAMTAVFLAVASRSFRWTPD